MADVETLAERVRTVERAVTDGAGELPEAAALADIETRIETLEERVEDIDDRATELEAATQALRVESNRTLERRRDRLQAAVAASNRNVEHALVAAVYAETAADRPRSRAIVADSMATWETPAARARALSNGSAAHRVAAVAASWLALSPMTRDWLRVRLRGATRDALNSSEAQPSASVVDGTASTVRQVARSEGTRRLEDEARRGAEAVAKRRLGTSTLPAGLPVAPPLAPWYATANIWWVTVEGEYARFAVSAQHGTPTTPGARTTYARDGDAVRLDVDGDGDAERLGTATRVSFRAETGVVVVVPPRPRGVGDKDGQAVEESTGWPDAGR